LNDLHHSINEFTVLNIGIVEAICQLNKKYKLNLNIKIPKSKINPEEAYKKIISTLLSELKLYKNIPHSSFYLLDLYLGAVSIQHSAPGNSAVSSEEIMHWIEDQIFPPDGGDDSTAFVRKFLDKTKLVMIGMSKTELLDDQPDLILQRAIFLAITRKNINSIDNIDRNLKLGCVVNALSKLLIIFRSKISDLPKELWRKNREQFDNYLFSSEQIVQQNKYLINSEFKRSRSKFSSKTLISINDINICSREIEIGGELLEVVHRLKSLGYKPSPGEDSSILIKISEENGPIIPIKLEVKECPVTNLKRNIVISTHVAGLSKLLDMKKTRLEFLQLMHDHMVSVGIAGKEVIEISRYQLADTMDRDELLHHIDLIRSAYNKLTTIYKLN
jgi:hypothetical protein